MNPPKKEFVGGSEEREVELRAFWKKLWLSNWTDKEHLKVLNKIVPRKNNDCWKCNSCDFTCSGGNAAYKHEENNKWHEVCHYNEEDL